MTYEERDCARGPVWILLTMLMLSAGPVVGQQFQERRVVVERGGWELIGDLRLPTTGATTPVVLMLNKAAGDRTAYVDLARELESKGIGSLRLDLPGHGESTNLGRFSPGLHSRDPMIWDAEKDVAAAHAYLKSLDGVGSAPIAIIGGSYSGEEMAESGRLTGYAQAYVALSPGSFSDESIAGIDASGVPWLFVVSNNERHLKEIEAEVRRTSQSVEMIIVPGTDHASELLAAHPTLNERIAVWLESKLISR